MNFFDQEPIKNYGHLTLLIEISRNFLSISIPIYLLHDLFATIQVVLDHENGSRIISFSLVDAIIILRNNSSGFWVGCFPCTFSCFFGG